MDTQHKRRDKSPWLLNPATGWKQVNILHRYLTKIKQWNHSNSFGMVKLRISKHNATHGDVKPVNPNRFGNPKELSQCHCINASISTRPCIDRRVPPKSAPPKASFHQRLRGGWNRAEASGDPNRSVITDFIIYLFQYHRIDKGSEFRYQVSWLVFSFCWDLFCFTRFGSTCWHSMLGERHLSWLSLTSRTLGACDDNNLHQPYVMNL